MIPPEKTLLPLFFDENECLRSLDNRGVFYETLVCPGCGGDMTKKLKKQVFRCKRKSCKKRELSIRSNTFFYGSRLRCSQIIRIGYLWLSGATHFTAQKITGLSKQCITDFFYHFRQLVSSNLEEEDMFIGGPGIIVQVDETKLGKRKYNKGHRVDGVWAAVGIEHKDNPKIFIVPLENRNAETMTRVIAEHVDPRSILHTDCWKGYSKIQESLGIVHQTVNHSKQYVDTETGACTNRAEGLNGAIKRKIPIRSRIKNGIEEHFGEYVWRRLHKNNLWDALIKALVDTHYDK